MLNVFEIFWQMAVFTIVLFMVGVGFLTLCMYVYDKIKDRLRNK